MSIAIENRDIALMALTAIEKVPNKEEKVKEYLNAVQKAMLLLGTQGLKRMVLYITSQMSKEDKKEEDNKKAWGHLYEHLAGFLNEPSESFQYNLVMAYSKEKVTLIEEKVGFFLLCLKRLANSKISQLKDNDKKTNN